MASSSNRGMEYLQMVNVTVNKKALPFPAETASKKPSADIRYLTPFGA